MLEVCLCKPVIYELKILGWVGWGGVGGGDLNFINQLGEPRKGGKQKGKERGDYHFWLKFSGGGALKETVDMDG